MSSEHLSMAEARHLICAELRQFVMFVRDGLSPLEAVAAMGLRPRAADEYGRVLAEVLALAANTVNPAPGLEAIRARTQKSETAPEAPGAAQDEHEGAHHS